MTNLWGKLDTFFVSILMFCFRITTYFNVLFVFKEPILIFLIEFIQLENSSYLPTNLNLSASRSHFFFEVNQSLPKEIMEGFRFIFDESLIICSIYFFLVVKLIFFRIYIIECKLKKKKKHF